MLNVCTGQAVRVSGHACMQPLPSSVHAIQYNPAHILLTLLIIIIQLTINNTIGGTWPACSSHFNSTSTSSQNTRAMPSEQQYDGGVIPARQLRTQPCPYVEECSRTSTYVGGHILCRWSHLMSGGHIALHQPQ